MMDIVIHIPGIRSTLLLLLASIMLLFFATACTVDAVESGVVSGYEEISTPLPSVSIAREEGQEPQENSPGVSPTPTDMHASPNEIVLWHGLTDQGVLALEEITAKFQSEHPEIRVSLVYIPYDDLQERFIDAVKDGNGPHMLLGAGEWGPLFFDLGVITAIPKETPQDIQLEITPPALDAVIYQDSLTGLPFSLEGVVVYRNAAILPHASENFEEMVKHAQEVTKGRIIGAYLERGDYFAYAQLTACQGLLLFSNGYPAFNSSEGLCWLNLLSLFESAGPVAFNTDDDINRFKAGNVGLIFGGTWNLKALQESLGENLVIDPWPVFGDSHLSGYVWTENVYLAANLSEDKYDMALVFARFFLSPQGQSTLAEIGMIPATLYRDIQERLIFQAVAALIKGTHFPVIPEMEFYQEPMHELLLSVYEGEIAPSLALKNAEEVILGLVGNDSKENDLSY